MTDNKTTPEFETAILGGGCFWCLEAVFDLVDGVEEVVPGYCGGHVEDPSYRQVCSGGTGHAEVIHSTETAYEFDTHPHPLSTFAARLTENLDEVEKLQTV